MAGRFFCVLRPDWFGLDDVSAEVFADAIDDEEPFALGLAPLAEAHGSDLSLCIEVVEVGPAKAENSLGPVMVHKLRVWLISLACSGCRCHAATT